LDNPATVGVTISTDAFPQPHLGDEITLSHTKLTLNISADLLQQGVDAGIISNGLVVTSNVTLVVGASNASPSTHTYKLTKQKATVHVVNGQAQPLTVTVPLENTKWNPKSKNLPVLFTEKSLAINSSIPILGTVHAIFTCAPNGTLQFAALAANGTSVPTTTPVHGQGHGSATTTTTVAAVSTSGETLPRTGANVLFLLVIAAILVDLGFALTGAARKRIHHFE
jgi:hypothetical protein